MGQVSTNSRHGFTIVELLIVIVVIGILAAITIVAYNGVQNRSNNTAVQSDLRNFHTKMALYHVDNDRYPSGAATLPEVPTLPTIGDLKLSKQSYKTSNNAVLYCSPADGSNYALIAKSKSGTIYSIGSATGTVTSPTMAFPTGMTNDCPAVNSSQARAQWLHANNAWVSWVQ